MFEDKNQNQGNAQPTQPDNSQQKPSPAPSSALTQQVGNSNPAAKKPGEVEDIFADTDTGAPNQAAVPAQSSAPQQNPAPQGSASAVPGLPNALTSGKLKQVQGAAGVPSAQVSGAGEPSFPVKKIVIIAGISLGIVGIAVAGFLILKNRSGSQPQAQPSLGSPQDSVAPEQDTEPSQNTQPDENIPQDSTAGEESSNNSEGGILNRFQQDQIDRALNPIAEDPASLDTDQDGLSDAQEFSRGTNPRLVDSDNDGLSDWEEVAIFGTDALNVDSDGDTYIDGEEVQNGYDPLGPGKLLDFEKAE
ncbi:hypothetical protein CL632_01210 [bacterium]|jgi:hypothetical protein|nr:hypothetical protein [bacterium]MDP6571262.1 hypothetical protein [Patescibacteria group bacterium]MDP6756268.1 hypothetical protein [Patescibacteria group bacterium]|tara:strand:+ start:215 stop:1126 length:912 start_codon:yes stop_codon:yes gene_type:complete